MSGQGSNPTANDRTERTTAPSGEGLADGDESAPRLRPAEDLGSRPEHDMVDEAGEDSFPSSDPPSWSRAVAL